MEMSTSPEEYFQRVPHWLPVLQKIRAILQNTELTETMKWGMPVYTYNKKNIVGIGAFKDYVGIWFYQGVFLKDELGVLTNAQEGKTKAMRQWRFENIDKIDEEQVHAYVEEAIANQIAGLEVKPEKKPLVIPKELQEALNNDAQLQYHFDTFTLGKKKEFANYISEAKREATRMNRLKKIKPLIMTGISLNDKYRKK